MTFYNKTQDLPIRIITAQIWEKLNACKNDSEKNSFIQCIQRTISNNVRIAFKFIEQEWIELKIKEFIQFAENIVCLNLKEKI